MQLDQDQLLAIAGVVAILLAVVFWNTLQSAKQRNAPSDEEPTTGLLCKFAHHNGSVVGETVAITDGQLILKLAGAFRAVPVNLAKEADGDVVLTGEIDWAAAEQAGKAWHESNSRGADDAVGGTLTRSEDVRAPALAAFQARHGDKEEE